jgi:hypothetical protein
MNAPETHPNSSRWLKRLALPLVLLSALALLVVGVTGYFRLGRDARCLRNSLTRATISAPLVWNKKIELSVGPLSCLALRAGLSFAPLDPEARTALRAVRGAEVGIYELDGASGRIDPGALLSSADEATSSRGWDRVVGVGQKHELVAVYVPKRPARGAKLQVCVAVLNRDQLVVAAGRSDLDPLMELVTSRTEWKQSRQWVAARF